MKKRKRTEDFTAARSLTWSAAASQTGWGPALGLRWRLDAAAPQLPELAPRA